MINSLPVMLGELTGHFLADVKKTIDIKNSDPGEDIWYEPLHDIKSDDYSVIASIEELIGDVCNGDAPLYCAEVFAFAGMECPKELIGYGWVNPWLSYMDGYFYSYKSGADKFWHIKFPIPTLIKQEE